VDHCSKIVTEDTVFRLAYMYYVLRTTFILMQ